MIDHELVIIKLNMTHVIKTDKMSKDSCVFSASHNRVMLPALPVDAVINSYRRSALAIELIDVVLVQCLQLLMKPVGYRQRCTVPCIQYISAIFHVVIYVILTLTQTVSGCIAMWVMKQTWQAALLKARAAPQHPVFFPDGKLIEI